MKELEQPVLQPERLDFDGALPLCPTRTSPQVRSWTQTLSLTCNISLHTQRKLRPGQFVKIKSVKTKSAALWSNRMETHLLKITGLPNGCLAILIENYTLAATPFHPQATSKIRKCLLFFMIWALAKCVNICHFCRLWRNDQSSLRKRTCPSLPHD